ncbi:hypothetical protein [Tropicibacter alexandrii]|uniref:hypothetical protein n=1 Tax=Tropicibacter alexandrii TaxID=2267683 RepID=UPI000EF4CE51|nr:hypothetical protein [Tropicibacter alexandrii]
MPQEKEKQEVSGTPFELSLASNPVSGTGSDLHQQDQLFEFGAINMGGPEPLPWHLKLAKDLGYAVIIAVAVKIIMGKKGKLF